MKWFAVMLSIVGLVFMAILACMTARDPSSRVKDSLSPPPVSGFDASHEIDLATQVAIIF